MRIGDKQCTVFNAERVHQPIAVDEHAAAWSKGELVVENMRVADFLAELGRYRTGILRCDSAIVDLQVSGIFSLRDIDRTLRNLAFSLPAQVVYHTRYWVTVQAKV